MTLSGKSAFLAALLFVAALGLYHYADSLINPKQAPKAPEKLYTATGFSGSIFNEQGKRTRTLEAEVAIYHEDSGIYTFQMPKAETRSGRSAVVTVKPAKAILLT